MTPVLVLSGAEIGTVLDVDALVVALEDAFQDLSAGRCSAPPRVGAFAPAGLVGAMPGYVPGHGLVAKLITVFPDNPRRGLPAHQGLVALFDESNGLPTCILDAGAITALRTATASAVATKALARPDAHVLAIVGAGAQAAAHLDAVPRVRTFDEVRIASRSHDRAAALAETHPLAVAVPSVEDAVEGADVVCCCTDARQAVLHRRWLAPGAHVVSVGTGTELDAETVTSARVFVEWRGAATEPPPAGAAELQHVDPEAVTELGEVLSGAKPGRTAPDEITLYKSTGHALEDAVAASLVHEQARREGAGLVVEL